ncbi:nucleoside hydrolase [Fibrella forsythiae]|uniref:Nucleoside hydrolase n=1 Tax=Fibrella forsythiae TaxID=2817061 RepID=A0ABS3JN91_9BACT|nr:nucleoside hydrolase [Fibrella forsythiae]MBO0951471.1 nucleoside hydrolase [Fibrella forsythiae]
MHSSIRCFLLFFLLVTYPAVSQKSKPMPVIFDTDMGPDYDDVGAITMLHSYADAGKVKLLATIASSKYPRVVPVLSVLNTYFGRPNLPIGVPKAWAVTDADTQHWSDTLVARYPHSLKTNEAAPDAVALYRKLLASQPDHSVTIITVGFLTNLANLLNSVPDQFSKLTGPSLVSQKVKQVVSMAGKFPAGHEYNVHRDTTASKAVFTSWPTPMLLSGFEIGQAIKTGLPLVQNTTISKSPVKDVFRISLPLVAEDRSGRMSWDQTAVLVAVEGPEPYYTTKTGRLILGSNGSNTWDNAGKGHAHLVVNRPPAEVEAVINRLMQHIAKGQMVKE